MGTLKNIWLIVVTALLGGALMSTLLYLALMCFFDCSDAFGLTPKAPIGDETQDFAGLGIVFIVLLGLLAAFVIGAIGSGVTAKLSIQASCFVIECRRVLSNSILYSLGSSLLFTFLAMAYQLHQKSNWGAPYSDPTSLEFDGNWNLNFLLCIISFLVGALIASVKSINDLLGNSSPPAHAGQRHAFDKVTLGEEEQNDNR